MLDIRVVGDEVLRQKAKPVRRVNKEVQTLLREMAETMYKADGIGLAVKFVIIMGGSALNGKVLGVIRLHHHTARLVPPPRPP